MPKWRKKGMKFIRLGFLRIVVGLRWGLWMFAIILSKTAKVEKNPWNMSSRVQSFWFIWYVACLTCICFMFACPTHGHSTSQPCPCFLGVKKFGKQSPCLFLTVRMTRMESPLEMMCCLFKGLKLLLFTFLVRKFSGWFVFLAFFKKQFVFRLQTVYFLIFHDLLLNFKVFVE